jgi:putative ABC transport system permease protein
MIKHLIKLVWNRKRANFLISLEIFISFLVLFAVIVLAVYFSENYRRPLGFSYENVWNVQIDMKQLSDNYHLPEQVETVRQLYLALKEFDQIEAAAGAFTIPFSSSGGSIGRLRINGRSFLFRRNEVTDDLDKVMGVKLIRGRWFGKEDDGSDWQPVVINRLAEQTIFGNEDSVGKDIPGVGDPTKTRVVGVVEEFRHGSDFADPEIVIFFRTDLSDPGNRPPRNLLIKLRPGMTRQFEERLVARLQAVAKDWSFQVQPLVELREEVLQQLLVPVSVAGLVAAFLMIMVALGLTGVLWQNVTQRTKEIGLRRAKGATRPRIYRQILGELFIVTSFGLLAGVLVVVQFPLLNLIGFISAKVYVVSIIVSLVIIYLLTFVCGLYPSWLATKVQPAEALHYE